MSFYVVDIEADGPIPHKYSMVSLGAVKVIEGLEDTFFGKTKPISDLWLPDALAISNISRHTHLTYDDPKEVMLKFKAWIEETNDGGRPIFFSDNLAFDWQWINYYFHYYTDSNPFGFSGRRIGDLYGGMKMSAYTKWKHLRETKHTHHPVDDAKGNAEVLLKMKKMGLDINFK